MYDSDIQMSDKAIAQLHSLFPFKFNIFNEQLRQLQNRNR